MSGLLSGVPVYWLNFALHTLLLSVFVSLACRVVRDPRRRAFTAALGVMAIVSLPWVSALRPFAESRQRVMEFVPPAAAAAADASGWTIRLEDVAVETMPVAAASPAAAPEQAGIGWGGVVMFLWLAGTAAGVVTIMIRQWRLMRWNSGNRALLDEEWQSIHGLLPARDQVRVCCGTASPCVIGFFRMKVVVPSFLFGRHGDRELHWAVRHEAEHLRSGDPRVAVLLSLAKAVMWWNPAVRSLCVRWMEDRERVCDARAAADAAGRHGYGSFLLDLTERLPAAMKGAVPMAAGLTARRMKKRLQAILRGDRVKENPLAFRIVSCLLMVAAGLLASFAGIEKAAGGARLSEVPVVEPGSYLEVPGVRADSGNGVDGKAMAAEEKPFKAPPQVRLISRFLKSRERIPKAGEVVSDIEAAWMMGNHAKTEGAELMTPPSVTMRMGQKASVEMIRTSPGQGAVSGETRKVPFVGMSLEATPGAGLEGISIAIDCLMNFAPGETSLLAVNGEWPVGPPKDFDWKTVISASAKDTVTLKSGQTLILEFKGMEGGRHLTGFFTVLGVDATGRLLDHSGELLPPYEEALAAWEGKVANLRAAIIQLPDDGRLASYWFGEDSEKPPGTVSLFYPSRHFNGIVAEAAGRPGGRRERDLTTISVREKSGSVNPWKDDDLRIGVDFTGTRKLSVTMDLPEIGEVKTAVRLGFIHTCELKPGEGGRRRMLLFALDE